MAPPITRLSHARIEVRLRSLPFCNHDRTTARQLDRWPGGAMSDGISRKAGEKMSRAFVFPGQGSQAVGMGRDLSEAFAAARYLFQEVDEALKQNLSRLMFEGPDSDLTLTENAQ